MSEPNEHDRIIEILKQARRPEGEVTAESREENLRWLMQAAAPEEEAPEALRQKVQTLTGAHSALPHPAVEATAPPGDEATGGRRWWKPLRHRSPRVPRRWRRLLLGAVPLAVASLALFLLLALPAPAGILDRTLSAMTKVRSAHCTGWFISYSDKDPDGRLIPGRMQVEWWYEAPDRYRKVMGSEVPGWNREPGILIVQGGRGLFTSDYNSLHNLKTELPPTLLAAWLSPFDFFTGTGILGRAQREKRARVSTREGQDHEQPVKIVNVEVLEQQGGKTLRQRWVLWVDPASDRIVRSRMRNEWREKEGSWEAIDEETLDHFEYNVSVKASLFQLEFPRGREQPRITPPLPRKAEEDRQRREGAGLR